MSEGGGLPEASLNDSCAAKFSGLKSIRTAIRNAAKGMESSELTSFNLSNIWTVVSQSTQASVMLTPYLSPEGPMWRSPSASSVKERAREANRTIFRNVLPATVDIGLDHHTCDGAVASNQLFADGVDDLGLVEVVLERVSI